MRKRVINHVADTIFWYILYFLPVLAYLMFVISAPFRGNIQTDISQVKKTYTYTIPEDTRFSFEFAPLEELFVFNVMVIDPSSGAILDFGSQGLVIPSDNADYFFENYSFLAPFAFVVDGTFDNTGASMYTYTLTRPFSFTVNSIISDSSFLLGVAVSEFDLFYSVDFGFFSRFDISYVENFTSIGGFSVDLSSFNFKDFVNSMGFEFATDNIIVNSLSDIFGTGGVMPMFDNDTPFIIFAWFIGVYLLHLLVDFLLFIPRIAHKWMKDCTGGD